MTARRSSTLFLFDFSMFADICQRKEVPSYLCERRRGTDRTRETLIPWHGTPWHTPTPRAPRRGGTGEFGETKRKKKYPLINTLTHSWIVRQASLRQQSSRLLPLGPALRRPPQRNETSLGDRDTCPGLPLSQGLPVGLWPDEQQLSLKNHPTKG